ncbi:MAG: hypothetical protein JST70_16010 [Bacteroidetes bacterium]|nr:hypothetical protein [Bacteroidota bacterium]
MKKLTLTAAILFAAISMVKAQANANSEVPGTVDNTTLVGSLGITDMIDLVPEYQVAGNNADTWSEFENGLNFLEAWPNTPVGGNDIEFRISATRHFHASVKGATFTRIGGGDPGLPASSFKWLVYSYSTIPGGAAENGFGTGNGAALSTSAQNFLQGDGCYNKLFITRLSLNPGAAYGHLGGTYQGNIMVTGTLAP